MKPIEPVPRGGPAGLVPGRYKREASDFVVEEIPAYEPSGSGEHLYLLVEKRGLSTFDAVSRLGRALGRRDREFGFAGMKDARAVTRQWISIQGVDEAAVSALQLDGVTVLEARRHTNKLKMGHLRGNRFSVMISGAEAEHAEAVAANLGYLAEHGVPNYFGEQRFGKRGANLDKGLKILGGNPRKAARSMPRRLLSLVVSAVQSEVFNRVLITRRDEIDDVRPGDVAWLHRNGACFVVGEGSDERGRCTSFEISPSGPLPGPKMLRAEGDVGELEEAALRAVGLSYEVFGKMPYGTHDGARRPLRVPVGEPAVSVEREGLRVSFELPRGAYATAVLRELLADCPWFG